MPICQSAEWMNFMLGGKKVWEGRGIVKERGGGAGRVFFGAEKEGKKKRKGDDGGRKSCAG